MKRPIERRRSVLPVCRRRSCGDSASLQWKGLFVRRYRFPKVVDRYLVPATPRALRAPTKSRARWTQTIPALADSTSHSITLSRAAFPAASDIPEDEWDRVLNINLRAVFVCMKHGKPRK